jgi:hypothetical protein
MLLRFQYVTELDEEKSNKWNPIVANPTQINQNNSEHFIAQFNVSLLDEFPVDWLGKGSGEPISVLLVHYNPLKKVWNALAEKPIPFSDLEQFRAPNSILSREYGDQILTFHSEMLELERRFGLSVLEIADQAELIVCCYGEFMETPYQEKHIFQGNSRGKVFVNGRSKGVFETQSTHSYS